MEVTEEVLMVCSWPAQQPRPLLSLPAEEGASYHVFSAKGSKCN